MRCPVCGCTLISIHALLAESDNTWTCFCVATIHDFYPRSPCGERRSRCPDGCTVQPISIHALLAESDVKRICFNAQIPEFLSTLSLRRATRPAPRGRRGHADFYPRSPCGERPFFTSPNAPLSHFYPRSPCGERLADWNMYEYLIEFLSTLSLRRATRRESRQQPAGEISIHALLAESDSFAGALRATENHFYPRSPCGERRASPHLCIA